MNELTIKHLSGTFVEAAIIVAWHKKDGEYVKKGEIVVTVETRKVTADLEAPADGILKQEFPAGERVLMDAVIGTII